MNNAQVHVERIKELKRQLDELHYKESLFMAQDVRDFATISNTTYLIGELNREIAEEYHKLFDLTSHIKH